MYWEVTVTDEEKVGWTRYTALAARIIVEKQSIKLTTVEWVLNGKGGLDNVKHHSTEILQFRK